MSAKWNAGTFRFCGIFRRKFFVGTGGWKIPCVRPETTSDSVQGQKHGGCGAVQNMETPATHILF